MRPKLSDDVLRRYGRILCHNRGQDPDNHPESYRETEEWYQKKYGRPIPTPGQDATAELRDLGLLLSVLQSASLAQRKLDEEESSVNT